MQVVILNHCYCYNLYIYFFCIRKVIVSIPLMFTCPHLPSVASTLLRIQASVLTKTYFLIVRFSTISLLPYLPPIIVSHNSLHHYFYAWNLLSNVNMAHSLLHLILYSVPPSQRGFLLTTIFKSSPLLHIPILF